LRVHDCKLSDSVVSELAAYLASGASLEGLDVRGCRCGDPSGFFHRVFLALRHNTSLRRISARDWTHEGTDIRATVATLQNFFDIVERFANFKIDLRDGTMPEETALEEQRVPDAMAYRDNGSTCVGYFL
jgi:hypothetical protein